MDNFNFEPWETVFIGFYRQVLRFALDSIRQPSGWGGGNGFNGSAKNRGSDDGVACDLNGNRMVIRHSALRTLRPRSGTSENRRRKGKKSRFPTNEPATTDSIDRVVIVAFAFCEATREFIRDGDD